MPRRPRRPLLLRRAPRQYPRSGGPIWRWCPSPSRVPNNRLELPAARSPRRHESCAVLDALDSREPEERRASTAAAAQAETLGGVAQQQQLKWSRPLASSPGLRRSPWCRCRDRAPRWSSGFAGPPRASALQRAGRWTGGRAGGAPCGGPPPQRPLGSLSLGMATYPNNGFRGPAAPRPSSGAGARPGSLGSPSVPTADGAHGGVAP